MIEGVNIPNLPGYVSVKEAAAIIGVSDKRVYQYVMSGRLSALRIGHILVLPLEEVKQFKPSPSGRVRAKAPSWRSYRSRGNLLATDIHVHVRPGQQTRLLEKLRDIQKADEHTFPGTIARYVIKGDTELTTIHIFFIWKDTELPDDVTRQHDLHLFQKELEEVLDWGTAEYDTNNIILHT